MSEFEIYLLSLGYEIFYFDYDSGLYKRPERYELDVDNIFSYSYFHYSEEDIIQAIDNGIHSYHQDFPKSYFSKCIIYGYNDGTNIPTLIYPRPTINVFCFDTTGKKIVETAILDRSMNLVLNTKSPKEIYKSIYDKSVVFNFDKT